MSTYKTPQNAWICELRIAGVLCICEANQRGEARRGAIKLARQRAANKPACR